MNQTKSNHRGGKRVGAGRKTSALTIRTRAMAEQIIASGITPLEYMIALMRAPKPEQLKNETLADYEFRLLGWRTQGFEAAKAAAPYLHPRLAAIEHSGQDGNATPRCIEIRFVRPPERPPSPAILEVRRIEPAPR